jgi:topoisomerase-4 subunit A
MFYCGLIDKELVFNVIFREESTKYPYIKRCKIDQFILNKAYNLVPDDCTVLKVTTDSEAIVTIEYKPKPRLKLLLETFAFKNFLVKGSKAGGVRLANKEMKSVKVSEG